MGLRKVASMMSGGGAAVRSRTPTSRGGVWLAQRFTAAKVPNAFNAGFNRGGKLMHTETTASATNSVAAENYPSIQHPSAAKAAIENGLLSQR